MAGQMTDWLKDDLVKQVKDIQRNDPQGKMAWWKYADEQGSGMRDPAKHEPPVLLHFVSQYHSGAYVGVQYPSSNPGESDFVKQVKDIQRNDSQGRLAWRHFADEQGGSIHDPAKHDPSVLLNFLSQYHAGVFQGIQEPPHQLGELFKEAQRNSPAFKNCWAMYVRANSLPGNDPAKNSKESLVQFLEYMGQTTSMAMMSTMNNAGYGGGMMGMMGGGCGKGGMKRSSGDPQKDALVEHIKNFQRGGPMNMQAWTSFCEQHEFTKLDPARQSIEMLQMFCASVGIGSPPSIGWGEPMMKKPKTAAFIDDPVKAELVDKIKNFQRSAEENKQAWWNYCDQLESKKRDPALHDTEILQEFCGTHFL